MINSKAVLLSVNDAARALSVSRSTIYNLLNDVSLPAVKLGGRTMISADQLRRFAKSLEAYKPTSA